RAYRLVRGVAWTPQRPGAVRAALDGDRDRLRLVAVRRQRGRADVTRDRRRARTGRADARRWGLADLLAGHPALDPPGGRLRRHPDDCPFARRVRCSGGRLRQAPGTDRNGDAPRPGALRELRSRRCLCDLARTGTGGRARTRRHDRVPTEGGDRLVMSILVRNVSKSFGAFAALTDVSLEVDGGSLTALLGPSGSGKSTLLRIIAGLEFPDAGEILIAGSEATALKPRKRNVGFVFQHYAVFKHMTVRDNVAFGLKV